MPKLIADSDMIYLRATPIPRALESVQQAFWGFYPPSARAADFPAPTILTRTPADETLFPNEGACRRFAQLSRAFAQRSAEKWNDTDEMKYVDKQIGKWMPADSPKVAVDSRPRLSGILDTINSTDVHGPETKLPKEFYDPKLRFTIDKICVEEWYSGYTESQEYRMLGIGSLMGDIVGRMMGNIERSGGDGLVEIGGDGDQVGIGRGGEKRIRFAMSGCHDTTLSAVLMGLGTYEGRQMRWPPYTSHIAFEMFRSRKKAPGTSDLGLSAAPNAKPGQKRAGQGWWGALFGGLAGENDQQKRGTLGRRPLSELTTGEKQKLDDYYVRVRFNDEVMQVPGCKQPGKHLEGDETLCTLVSTRDTPAQWLPC